MKLLDRYIFQKFFVTFLVILVIVIVLILLIDVTENTIHFKKYHLSIAQIAHYYGVLIPFIVNLLAPIIVFVTTTWVTIRLSQRSEIIAMLSGGISFRRIMSPYCIIALFLTGVNFYLTGWLLAETNEARIKFQTQYLPNDSMSDNQPTYLNIKVGPHQWLYIHTYHAYSHSGYDIRLNTFQEGALVEHLSAKEIEWDASDKKWIFKNWKKRKLLPQHEECTEGTYLKCTLAVQPEDFSIDPTLRESLTLPELNTYIQMLMEKGNEHVRVFIVEKYIRYMTPFSIIILIVLGFLVAVHKPRGGVSRQMTLGFILACLYIVLFLLAKIVTEAQSTHPLLHIWIPNILFTILCVAFYRLVPK